jgi:hypothetical protein
MSDMHGVFITDPTFNPSDFEREILGDFGERFWREITPAAVL